jgi:hypothetical protein
MKLLHLLVLLAFASTASAHTQTGSLGAAATATDYYQVVCSDDGSGPPASLVVAIEDVSPVATPVVSVQVQRGALVANSSDATDADGSASPLVAIDGGAGTYEVLIDKSATGTESYVLTFHCLTGPGGTGIHTGTDIIVRQNQ